MSAGAGNADVVLLRRTGGGRDAYGDPIPAEWERISLPDAVVAPRMVANNVQVDVRTDYARMSMITGLVLYAPPDVVILPADRVEVDGTVYDVEGDSGQWRSPFTDWAPGQQMALHKAEEIA